MTEKDLIKEIARELKKLMEIKSLKETKSELEEIKEDLNGIFAMSMVIWFTLLCNIVCCVLIIKKLW